MTVSIDVTGISIEAANDSVSPKMDRATVEVSIRRGGSLATVMTFHIRDYDNLDDVAEKVRREIFQFATDLAKAADQPLAGTRRGR